ncbi:hypothetical protein G6F63_014342 [Rhizopus arrhizus]|nr:hypothetical protein G6F63_014342 [Rhizopus arrhizus]
MGTRIQPGVAAAQCFKVQIAFGQVAVVEISDFQLATRRRLQLGCILAGVSIIEVQTGHSIVRTRTIRLLDQIDHSAVLVELGHAIALRIIHPLTEHRGSCVALVGALEHLAQAGPVEDVVSQHQAARFASHEVAADQIGLRQAIGAGLHRVLDVHAPLRAVAQQLLEQRLLVRGVDDQSSACRTPAAAAC